MDGIVKIGCNVWLVNGKVIGSDYDDAFEDFMPEGHAELLDIADNVCTGPLFAHAGDPMYAFFFRRSRAAGCRFLLSGRPHLRELPEDVKAELRKYMPEHAGEF